MRKFFPLIVFSLVLISLSIFIGYILGSAQKSKQAAKEAVQELPPPEEEIPAMKSYTSEKYGFTFDYPVEFELWEEQTSKTTYINMNGLYDLVTLEVSDQPNESYFSNLPVSKVVTYNGVDWSFHEASDYCDAGECGATNPGYTMRRGNLLFTLTLGTVNSDPLNAIKILSTFKFL